MDTRQYFVSALRLAGELGLPLAWVKTEADAGRIPCLRAGRRRLFNVEAVRRALDGRGRRRAKGAAR
jgi:hypothetical protein